MTRNRIILVTVGIMFSLFLASMESTVVATSMPTIVGQLGGLEHYSWVFSAFMLASTTSVPLYGKLSDIYGRRKIYVAAMALFLIGSVMSGQAQSMTQLILARALQGLGAGGIQPLAFILIGEMFNLQQRARMQGFFSGVWGFSSIVGPLLGGFIVDRFTWHWVFYINLPPGLIAVALVAFGWQEQAQTHERPKVDYLGAALLTSSIVSLLLGLTLSDWKLNVLAVIFFVVLLWVESRAADPILPLPLFRDRLFLSAVTHGIFTGWAMFGSVSFIPLFVQSVFGTSATQAGITVTPMLLGWVSASIIGMRLI
nr:MFS transporter [Anaerolineales bacterium]